MGCDERRPAAQETVVYTLAGIRVIQDGTPHALDWFLCAVMGRSLVWMAVLAAFNLALSFTNPCRIDCDNLDPWPGK